MAKRRIRPTREAKRMVSLLFQLEKEENKLTEIAEKLDYKHPSLSNIKSGKTKSIETEMIYRVYKKFGINPLYFFDDYVGEVDYHKYLGNQINGPTKALIDNLEEQVLNLADKVDELTLAQKKTKKMVRGG